MSASIAARLPARSTTSNWISRGLPPAARTSSQVRSAPAAIRAIVDDRLEAVLGERRWRSPRRCPCLRRSPAPNASSLRRLRAQACELFAARHVDVDDGRGDRRTVVEPIAQSNAAKPPSDQSGCTRDGQAAAERELGRRRCGTRACRRGIRSRGARRAAAPPHPRAPRSACAMYSMPDPCRHAVPLEEHAVRARSCAIATERCAS